MNDASIGGTECLQTCWTSENMQQPLSYIAHAHTCNGIMLASGMASVGLCMLTPTFFDCSLLNSNTCSAEHTPLSIEQQLGQSKQRPVPVTDPPALSPGPQPTLLHLPIITIPILITASDFIGALAAGKQCCAMAIFSSLCLLLVLCRIQAGGSQTRSSSVRECN